MHNGLEMQIYSQSSPSLTTFFLNLRTEVLNKKIDKMSLVRNWHTEGIDQKKLSFSVFSNGVRSKKSNIQNRHKVLISGFVE